MAEKGKAIQIDMYTKDKKVLRTVQHYKPYYLEKK
jgi:hypothetical protein